MLKQYMVEKASNQPSNKSLLVLVPEIWDKKNSLSSPGLWFLSEEYVYGVAQNCFWERERECVRARARSRARIEEIDTF